MRVAAAPRPASGRQHHGADERRFCRRIRVEGRALLLRNRRRSQPCEVDAGSADPRSARCEYADSVSVRDLRAPWFFVRGLCESTAHRAVGSDGARYSPAQDVAAQGGERILLRESPPCVLHLGPAHPREALPLRTTEPAAWRLHAQPEEGDPEIAQGTRYLFGRV